MRHLLNLMLLLLVTVWAASQSNPGQTTPGTRSNSGVISTGTTSNQESGRTQPATDESGKQVTAVGCVSSSNGSYILTSSNGKTYQLTGDTGQLINHVGHKVQIKGEVLSGSPSSSASTSAGSPDSSSPTASHQSTLNVSSIKHMSKTCNAK